LKGGKVSCSGKKQAIYLSLVGHANQCTSYTTSFKRSRAI